MSILQFVIGWAISSDVSLAVITAIEEKEMDFKLFGRRLLWPVLFLLSVIIAVIFGFVDAVFTFFATTVDIFQLPEYPKAEPEPTSFVETPEFYWLATDSSQPEAAVTEPEEVVPQGTQYVLVSGEKIPIAIRVVDGGYRVFGEDNPSIVGQGKSLSQAKYDFYLSYKRWKNTRSLIPYYATEK